MQQVQPCPASAHSRQQQAQQQHQVPLGHSLGFSSRQRKAAPASGSLPAINLRVLIAEDNLVNQKVLLKVLQRIMPQGIAFVANNGLEVLQVRLFAFPPKLWCTSSDCCPWCHRHRSIIFM